MSEYHNDIPQMKSSESKMPAAPSVKGTGMGNLVITRADVVRELRSKLPTNDLGLPNYIYRTDMVSTDYVDAETTQAERVDMLEAASYPLDYAEGYPMLPDGRAFWTKLDFEPRDAFEAFDTHLGTVRKQDDDGRIVAPVRTFEATAHLTGIPIRTIKEYAFLYYWADRAKAYDMFMVASFKKQRETRALATEDTHYKQSRKISQALIKRLEEIFADEEELAEMKPKEVIAALEAMMKMERLSVGLSSNGNVNGKDDGPRNASLSVALRNVAKEAGEESQEYNTDSEQIDNILADPDKLTKMQELIIEIGNGRG